MAGQTQSNIPTDLLSRAVDQALQGDLDLKLVLDSLPLGIVILELVSGQYRIHLTNQMFDRLFKLSIKESVGQTLDSLPQLADSSLPDQCDLVCESGDSAVFEWHQPKDSEVQFLSCIISPLNTDRKGPRLLLGTISDRSAEKRAEMSLLHNAHHDPLTDLPNRVLFQEMLEDELTGSKHHEGNFAAVLLLNIDRFQLVNETLGHVAGDEFLVSVANRLSSVCGLDTVLARLSGDEFGILARHLSDPSLCLQLAEQIHAQMEQPFSLGKLEFHASVSIGIATSESSPPYAEELIRDADFAMHRAKKNGRGSTVSFKRETHQRARSQLLLEVDLRKAIRQGEMELHYQPLVHLDSGALKGFEALARWRHPERGLIPPNEFISVAEECGLIVELGRWALLEACQQLKKWQQVDSDCAAITMAINVSGVQFASGNLVDDVEQALRISGVSGDSIVIELTESAVMENPDRTARILMQLSALGVKIALDDFGTGYSSLSYLQRFPLDIIKIDRSFVTNIGASEGNMKIVELVTLLGNALGLEIVAEGIETPEHLDHLRKLGCRIGQGFLFSKPMPQELAERFIRDMTTGNAARTVAGSNVGGLRT